MGIVTGSFEKVINHNDPHGSTTFTFESSSDDKDAIRTEYFDKLSETPEMKKLYDSFLKLKRDTIAMIPKPSTPSKDSFLHSHFGGWEDTIYNEKGGKWPVTSMGFPYQFICQIVGNISSSRLVPNPNGRFIIQVFHGMEYDDGVEGIRVFKNPSADKFERITVDKDAYIEHYGNGKLDVKYADIKFENTWTLPPTDMELNTCDHKLYEEINGFLKSLADVPESLGRPGGGYLIYNLLCYWHDNIKSPPHPSCFIGGHPWYIQGEPKQKGTFFMQLGYVRDINLVIGDAGCIYVYRDGDKYRSAWDCY
jgi:uncharacterized protein YwqG